MKLSSVAKCIKISATILAIIITTKLLLPFIAEPIIGKTLLINPSGFSRRVYANKGELLRVTLSSDDKLRIWTPLSKISPSLVAATLLQEDRYFYWHPGINPWAILKGAYSTYISGTKVGASTITMQLARLRFGIRSRYLSGKLSQIAHALMLEALYSKSSILEAYLNIAPYGGNIEGVAAASLTYFNKDSADLNWSEAISLSVIPQDPNNRIPSDKTKSYQLARNRLYERTKRTHKTPASLFDLEYPSSKRTDLPYVAPHFVQRLLETYPEEAKIESSLDYNLQNQLERLLTIYIERNRKIGIQNAAILLLDSESMDVRAYIGSANFWSKEIAGQNDGIRARRSPGSALKPFLYALALEQGLIHPTTLLKDTEFSRASYNPENYEKDFVGPINATEALIRSRNIPAVMLLNQLSPSSFYNFLQSAKVLKLKNETFYGLSMILGGVEVSMGEIASLYAMLSRGGNLASPSLLKSPTSSLRQQQTKLLSAEASKLTLEMLRENPRPLSGFDSMQTKRSLAIPWKTGTSFGFRDAWAAGIIGPYTLVIWLGNFDGKGNPAFIGRDAAGPLFFSISDALTSAGSLVEPLPRSSLNIKTVKVCSVSGELPGPYCKQTKNSLFIPGKSPIHTCDTHRQVNINPVSGLRTCPGSMQSSEKKIIEFWSSDLSDLFKRAGLPRAIPPSFEASCQSDALTGDAPLISSPQNNLVYKTESHRQTIPFSAVTDGDSIKTYWFVDDSFVGESAAAETFFWPAQIGQFLVRAVDSEGRANQVEIRVVGGV